MSLVGPTCEIPSGQNWLNEKIDGWNHWVLNHTHAFDFSPEHVLLRKRMQTANETLTYPQHPDRLAQEILPSLAGWEGGRAVSASHGGVRNAPTPAHLAGHSCRELYTKRGNKGLWGEEVRRGLKQKWEILGFLHILLLFQPSIFHRQLIWKGDFYQNSFQMSEWIPLINVIKNWVCYWVFPSILHHHPLNLPLLYFQITALLHRDIMSWKGRCSSKIGANSNEVSSEHFHPPYLCVILQLTHPQTFSLPSCHLVSVRNIKPGYIDQNSFL